MKVLCVSLLVLVAFSCKQTGSGNETTHDTSPALKVAEPSELALLMREMDEEVRQWKTAMETGDTPIVRDQYYERLVSATPTQPQMVGPTYDAYARLYENAVETFANSTKEQATATYNGVISACVACHSDHCQGPIPRIKKLTIPGVSSDLVSQSLDDLR
jgi:cytochrome c553